MMIDYLLRRTVKFILEEANNFSNGWELWGTGMLRLDLSLDVTLHVWDMRYRDPAVTLAHDHPWHFDSFVLSGRLTNERSWQYETSAKKATAPRGMPFTRQRIVCGETGVKLEDPYPVLLVPQPQQIVIAGDVYRQQKDVIHETFAEDGTVTLCRRTFDPTSDRDSANVYIPEGEEFGSAAPRRATPDEIHSITDQALSIWSDAGKESQ